MRKSVTVTDFTVEGRGVFPFDMLRYDECWPVGGAVNLGERATDAEGKERKRRVKLRTHQAGAPNVARWESFGWKVTEVQD